MFGRGLAPWLLHPPPWATFRPCRIPFKEVQSFWWKACLNSRFGSELYPLLLPQSRGPSVSPIFFPHRSPYSFSKDQGSLGQKPGVPTPPRSFFLLPPGGPGPPREVISGKPCRSWPTIGAPLGTRSGACFFRFPTIFFLFGRDPPLWCYQFQAGMPFMVNWAFFLSVSFFRRRVPAFGRAFLA